MTLRRFKNKTKRKTNEELFTQLSELLHIHLQFTNICLQHHQLPKKEEDIKFINILVRKIKYTEKIINERTKATKLEDIKT